MATAVAVVEVRIFIIPNNFMSWVQFIRWFLDRIYSKYVNGKNGREIGG